MAIFSNFFSMPADLQKQQRPQQSPEALTATFHSIRREALRFEATCQQQVQTMREPIRGYSEDETRRDIDRAERTLRQQDAFLANIAQMFKTVPANTTPLGARVIARVRQHTTAALQNSSAAATALRRHAGEVDARQYRRTGGRSMSMMSHGR